MKKRTGEIVLGVIGIIFSILFLFGGIFRLVLQYNKNFQKQIEDSIATGLDADNLNTLMDSLTNGGWQFTIAALLGIIFGILGVSNIKKNKNPKKAGLFFILSTLSLGLLTLGSGFFPAIIYLIAGIMSYVRNVNGNNSYSSESLK